MAKSKSTASTSIQSAISQLPRKLPLSERLSRWAQKMLLRAGLVSLVLFGGCVALLTCAPSNNQQSAIPRSSTTNSSKSPAQQTAQSPGPKSNGTSAKGFQESTAEKAYEQRSGKEVVHLKDGTTYERSQPKRAKK